MADITLPPLSIGIDIGGTTTRAGLVDRHGDVSSLISRPTVGGGVGVVNGTVGLVHELITRSGTDLADVELIGVGIPGMVDVASGMVRNAVNVGLGEHAIDLRSLLAEHLDRPLRLNNDVNVAALGAARELRDIDRSIGQRGGIAYIGIGTGIAAAWVLDGVVWAGASGASGEIGHISIDPRGPLCDCGQRGCIEALSSGNAISRRWPTDAGSSLEQLMAAARAGRSDAIEIWDSVVDGLASAVYIVTMSIDPEVVVLGGGIANHGTDLIPAIARALHERSKNSPLLESLKMADRLRHVRRIDHVGVVGAVIAASTADRAS